MRKIILTICIALISMPAFADVFKFNPYTGKLDNIGSFTFSLFPNCQDSGGNHLNFNSSTNTFSCGNSGGVGTSQWATQNTTDVSLAGGNVGIGTIKTTTSALTVMNGNVGIGTWVPSQALSVVGNVGVGTVVQTGGRLNVGPGGITLANGENIANGTDGTIAMTLTNSNGSEDLTFANSSTANKIVMSSTTGVTTLQVPAVLQIGSEALQVMFTPTPNLGYRTGNSNASSRWRVAPNGTPTVAEGGAISAVEIFDNDASLGGTDYSLLNIFDSPSYYQINSKRGDDATFHNKPIVFSNQDTNYLAIVDTTSATGNVGIGTWTVAPPAKLYVRQTGSGDSFRVDDQASDTTPFLVATDGNVGVGSLTPGAALDVNGAIRASGNITGANLSGTNTGDQTGANPTASVGTSAVNGSAATFLRSDAAPPIDQTMTPTWSGTHTFSNASSIVTSGNVGINTTKTTTSALNVMGGNIGLGTWIPGALLQVGSGTGLQVGNTGNLTSIGGSTSATMTASTLAMTGSPTVIKNVASSAGATMTYVGSAATDGVAEIRTTTGTGNGDKIKFTGGTNGGTTWGTFIGGNLGIGSLTPGTTLDVQGTTRTTGFQLSTNPAAGYVLVGNGVGVGTWMAPGTISTSSSSQWATQNTTDVSLAGGNVGVGTTKTTTAALSVMNGNVGIGTWVPSVALDVKGVANVTSVTTAGSDVPQVDLFTQQTSDTKYVIGVNGNGNNTNDDNLVISEGTVLGSTNRVTINPGGNVGIGTDNAPSKMYVAGTLEPQGFKLNQHPGTSYVLTSNSVGIGTWMNPADLIVSSPGSSQWTTVNTNDVYLPNSGNVGIGTSLTTTAALSVMNGGVGIGTWKAGHLLEIGPRADRTYFDNDSTGSYLTMNGVYTEHDLIQTSAGGGNGGGVTNYYQDDTGALVSGDRILSIGGYGSVDNAKTYKKGSGIASFAEATWTSSSSPANLAFYTTPVGSNTVGNARMNINNQGNVGIGTTAASPYGLSVMSGNVGIGTWVVDGGALIVKGGNVGIGTKTPQVALDVVGAVYATIGTTTNVNAFNAVGSINDFLQYNVQNTSNAANAQSGFSATADDGTSTTKFAWMGINNSAFNNPQTYNVGYAGDSEYLSLYNDMYVANGTSGKNLYLMTGGVADANRRMTIDGNGNVGVGTFTPKSLFTVAGGGVGIGTNASTAFITTAAPAGGLLVQGNVGIGTTLTTTAGLSVMTGNVGIGTWVTAAMLHVAGSGASTFSSNVGIGTLTPTGALEVEGGNVGIGTGIPLGKLVAFGGNVGIGTWIPRDVLEVRGTTTFMGVGVTGNVGVGTFVAPNPLYVVGTPMFTTGLNIGIGTASNQHLCIANNAVTTCL